MRIRFNRRERREHTGRTKDECRRKSEIRTMIGFTKDREGNEGKKITAEYSKYTKFAEAQERGIYAASTDRRELATRNAGRTRLLLRLASMRQVTSARQANDEAVPRAGRAP